MYVKKLPEEDEKINQCIINHNDEKKDEKYSKIEKDLIEKKKKLDIAYIEYHQALTEKNILYNIYLNEETDMYKIFDDYLISDKDKLDKLVEMCKDDNKLAFLVRDPMKHWIKKNNLLYMHKNEVFILKDKNGFAETGIDELNSLTDNLVDSLYNGLFKYYLK